MKPSAPTLPSPLVFTRSVEIIRWLIASVLLFLAPSLMAQAPKITTQPQSRIACPGSTVTFTVVATGATPLTYIWLKNRVTISGATSSTLTLANVSSSDAATYRVVVRNRYGTVTSAEAILTVAFSFPTITTQPQSRTNSAGSDVTFTVAASGCSPLTYQWKKNGTDISGATSATLNLSNVQAVDAADYSAAVTNPGGTTTSSSATLTVTPAAPTITTQPQSQTAPDGGSATFTVAAKGTTPFSYQWRRNSADIPGAASASLTLSPVQMSDAGDYTVVVSNSVGSATSSPAATLTVTVVAPSITAQPQDQTVTAGNTATFSVTATGTTPLSYQWQKGTSPISGATSSTLTLANVQLTDAGSYSVVVSNAAGSAPSSSATLTVNAAAPGVASITISPSSPTLLIGETVSLTAIGTLSDGTTKTLAGGGGTWATKTSMPTPRWEPSVGVIGGVVTAAGGYNETSGHQVVVQALSGNSWSAKNNRPFIQTAPAYAVIDNYLFLAGGTDCCVAISSLSRYDPSTDSWATTLPAMPGGARSHLTGGAINGVFYAAGGTLSGSMLARLEAYNVAGNTWRLLASMPTARSVAGSAVLDGLLYVLGGSAAGQVATTVVEAYNPANDTWTTRASMPSARYRLTAAAYNGLLYVFGGNNGVTHVGAVDVYDPVGNAWFTATPMPTPRTSPAAVVVGSEILLIGGFIGGGNTAVGAVEAFTPPEVIWTSSNPSVATVSSSGAVTGIAAGTTTITAIHGGTIRNSTTVTVEVAGAGWLGYGGRVTAHAARRADGSFGVLVTTVQGARYLLEYKNSLSDSEWRVITDLPGTGSVQELIDPSAPKAQRFYRVRIESISILK